MDLRMYLYERRIKGADLTRASRGKLSPSDISRIINRAVRHYPPSQRVRRQMCAALLKIGVPQQDIDQIEDLKAEI
jgi:hypothetical protein